MLDHHIQRSIVTTLKSEDGLTFSQLKPGDIDNKLFTYHLKIVIREGFVEKSEEGTYKLTGAGEKLWRRMSEKPEVIALRPFSVLLMIIRSPENGWLLYRRKTHPVKDKVAFMHAVPKGTISIADHARAEVLIKTGLDCEFTVVGAGFFHTFDGQELQGFTNFTLLSCESPLGELSVTDESADYFWVQDPDFSSTEMLPNTKPLHTAYMSGAFPFYLDEFVQLSR